MYVTKVLMVERDCKFRKSKSYEAESGVKQVLLMNGLETSSVDHALFNM